MDKKKTFPKDFLWGASTASHQVEGNTYNQWTVWELEHANELAKSAEKKLRWIPAWPEIKKQAQDPANYVSGEGVDHFRRYKLDFDIAKQLNLNAFRFSIEWSRLEPEQGKWDTKAVAHYRDYIRQLKNRGIEPVVNLWHWTNPVWFENLGGFEKRANLKYFIRYVEKVNEELLDSVKYVITVNEPNNIAWFAYMSGEWPPQKHSPLAAAQVYFNLVSAHKQAYKALKRRRPKLIITSALQGSSNVPANPKKIYHRLAAWLSNYMANFWYLSRVNNYHDVIGFNFYFKNYMKGVRPYVGFDNPKEPLSDIGWYLEPGSLIEVLRALHKKYRKPIIITENGVADSHDKYRKWWIDESIKAIEQALEEGIAVQGYFHWSLLDNFEWAYGWWPKFGLVAVDREHGMKRTVRPSAKWYAAKIKALRKDS